MKPSIFFLFIIIIGCTNTSDNSTIIANPEPNQILYKGMDLSFQTELEDFNVDYFDENGTSIELLDFVEENGTNLIRLKLWHTSQDGEN
ncbi:MAG: hypothetical protein HKP28_09410, partial [Winogradskyella sp.]|nr:hypothetical protein [Winogradskyella sp.]